MKFVLLLTVLLLLAQAGSAQFYVYHVSGNAALKTSTKAVPLRVRDAVKPGQALVLKSGAQVVLLDAAGHNLSYTKPGTATYATLQQAFQASSVGTGRAYLAYVWQSLNHHATAAPRQANAPLGGVARGNTPPLQAPADSAVLDQPVVSFQWQPKVAGAPCWFTLTDATGDPLLQVRTAAPALDVNTVLTRLKPNAVYYWSVSDTPGSAASAPRRAFVIADATGLQTFSRELADVLATPEDEAWKNGFRVAWFFGRAGRR